MSLKRTKEALLDILQATALILIIGIVGGISFILLLLFLPIFLGTVLLDCAIERKK